MNARTHNTTQYNAIQYHFIKIIGNDAKTKALWKPVRATKMSYENGIGRETFVQSNA